MSKKQPKENKLNITYYPEEFYFKVFPEATDEEYFTYLMADELELLKQMEKGAGMKLTHIRQVVIGNEYYEWLKKTKNENTSQNRLLYMSSLSDEEVERLWEKEFFVDFKVITHYIPITILSKEVIPAHSFRIPSALIERIQHSISNQWNVAKKDVLIHPEIVRGDYVLNDFDFDFVDEAENYFICGDYEIEENVIPSLHVQNQANMAFRFIPVAIRHDDKAIVSKKELEKDARRQYSLSERSFQNWVDELSKTFTFNNKCIGFPFPLIAEDIVEFIEESVEDMISLK